MAETSKHDPGWWQHILGALGLSIIIAALHHFHVSEAWVFSACFAAIWPAREFVQNGRDMLHGRSLAEWLPPAIIITAAEVAARIYA